MIHAFTPKWGIWLSNGLGVFKIIILVLVVFTGFAALAGRMHGPKPDNFSSFDGAGSACELPPYASSTKAANYALALLQVNHLKSQLYGKALLMLTGPVFLLGMGERQLRRSTALYS